MFLVGGFAAGTAELNRAEKLKVFRQQCRCPYDGHYGVISLAFC